MIYVSRKYLPRRTLLKGIGGAAVALPFLDAMRPAFAQLSAAIQPRRLGFIYFPNGYIKEHWTPAQEGTDYQILSSLEPLAPHRAKMSVLTGLACDPSKTKAGFHDRAIMSFLTGVEGSRIEARAGISVDQIAAPVLGKDTPFASLELATLDTGVFGGPCFKTATNRLPFETNPRLLFERMFGDTERLDPVALAKQRERQKSILDTIASQMDSLKKDLGPADRVKLDEYADSLRDIERRLAISEKIASQKITMERPAGPPDLYPDFIKMMFDLQVIALQTDMTRVWTFMLGQEATNQDYPEIGEMNSHHLISHHGGNPEKIAAMVKINRHLVDLFSYFIAKLDKVQEGESTLLDNSLIMYGSSLGDADRHMQIDLPILLMGGSAMGAKQGRHVKLPDETPISNLYLTMLDKAGVRVDKMGDSTGQLRGISDV